MSARVSQDSSPRPTLGVVIRFKNSAATLPAVLEALRRQTLQPDLILGIDNQSTDGSADLLRAAGAKVIDWTERYSHPRVLNFALRHCPTDLVLVLSSHTVLRSSDAIARLVAALSDPRTACASGKWDDDPFYSDAIDWAELQGRGLKFGSIYTNSMGILRRSLWEQHSFDESLPTMEDSAWALEQVRNGHICRRVTFDFSYGRSGQERFFVFALLTFKLAARHNLRVAWLGPRQTATCLATSLANRLRTWLRSAEDDHEFRLHRERLWAWLTWRWRSLPAAE